MTVDYYSGDLSINDLYSSAGTSGVTVVGVVPLTFGAGGAGVTLPADLVPLTSGLPDQDFSQYIPKPPPLDMTGVFVPMSTLDWMLGRTYLAYDATSGYIHGGLDVAGLVPGFGEVADGANAVLYGLEGDYENFLFSVGAMIPIFGTAATGAKIANKGAKHAAAEGMQATAQQAIKHGDDVVEVILDAKKYPGSAQHLKDPGFAGKELTIERAGASARREAATNSVPTKPSMDRDEMPPAMFAEGSQSVRHIPSGDNRGAGASIGNQLRNQPVVNPHAGKYEIVSTPYLSTPAIPGGSSTSWYLLADPNRLPTMEVAFLNGQDRPMVERADADFNTLGFQFRGVLDFGVKEQDWRGVLKVDP